MESYSQHGQDLYVYETFFKNSAAKGCFVEIGAYDGVTLSNTLLFERHLGWSGLCIEPLPSAFEKLRTNRSRGLRELRRVGYRRHGRFRRRRRSEIRQDV